MKKVINRRLIGDGCSYSLLARLQNFKRFPALIYTLFWSGFDADFYADIDDLMQILCRFLHTIMLAGSSEEKYRLYYYFIRTIFVCYYCNVTLLLLRFFLLDEIKWLGGVLDDNIKNT